MPIHWFGKTPNDGNASLYISNITLNKVASEPLNSAYKVQVGIDDNKNVVIKPLSKNQVERGDIPNDTIFDYQVKKSYSRICSSALMKDIASSCSLTLSKEPLKIKTEWKSSDGLLIIETNMKGVD